MANDNGRDAGAGTSVSTNILARAKDALRYTVSGVAPSNWFGPSQPIAPVAQEQAQGRQYDYLPSINTKYTPKDDGKGGISFNDLRNLADSLDVMRLVIETVKDQMCSMDWKIKAREGKTIADTVLAVITDKLKQPTPEYDWDAWLRMVMEDHMVLDAVAVYPRMNRGGGIYSLDLLDAGIIKRVVDGEGRTPMAPDPAYQAILKGVPAADYTTDELIYRIGNPRTHRGYGYSKVEQIVTTVNIALRRQMTQLQYFTIGNVPEALMSVPDTWNPDQVAQFQLYFDSLMEGNTANRSKIKFLPMDTAKFKETRQSAIKDEFDDWLARIVCYAFSVPPEPFIKGVNRATAESSKEAAEEQGLQPNKRFIQRLMDSILATKFGLPDAEFVWETKESIDPLIQAQIDSIYVGGTGTAIRSANEIREDRGWAGEAPLPPEPVAPVVVPAEGEGQAPPKSAPVVAGEEP
jgi:hypothetical protein